MPRCLRKAGGTLAPGPGSGEPSSAGQAKGSPIPGLSLYTLTCSLSILIYGVKPNMLDFLKTHSFIFITIISSAWLQLEIQDTLERRIKVQVVFYHRNPEDGSTL